MPSSEVATLAGLLAGHARSRPSAAALLAAGGQAVSYAQLFAQARRLRARLASIGLGRDARIAVLMPAGIELAIACLSTACNATCVPLNAALTGPELLALLENARIDAVMGWPQDPVAQRIAGQLGCAALAFERHDPSADDVHPEAPWPEATATAFILFTSGTTGQPKRVPLSQRQVVHSARNIAQHLGLGPEDRALGVMPAYHSHGLIGGLLAPLAAGSSVVCMPAFAAADFLDGMREFTPTWYTASPTIHHALVDLLAHHPQRMPAHRLRLIRSASAALSGELQHAVEQTWGVPVIQTYGMTETATQLASNPLPPGLRKPGSVGRPAGAELRVVDGEGHALPTGSTGAVVARGPAVFDGYEGTEAQAFQDGWFVTGDLGWFDADGYLFLAGRSKEQINRGGEKISPFEVEQALLALPGVAEAVAYPVAHRTLGEDLHAAVVLAPDSAAAGAELRAALFGVIADFKVPACIHVIPQIPTHAGVKVQRRDLQHRIPALVAAGTADTPLTTLTPLQLQVAAMFARTLGIPMVAADLNFLAEGGDSLSAVRLVQAANDAWGLDLPASKLLAAPTVIGFAATLQAAIEEADALSATMQADLDALSDDQVSGLLARDARRR